jgi:50S ribosomal protein L16 3-hydroxylase
MNLANLTPQQFLDEHWQKKPLPIRQAFENFTPPLDPDELAGLACEDDVESRLVIQTPGATPEWHVRQGPFTAEDFAALPPTHWTLLVQDVDKHVPECAELLDHFRFLPDWRIDDIMVSFAAPQGSVGPHIDAYDVFLLQGLGERRWLLDPSPETTSIIPDIELKLLNNFTPNQDHTLSSGDMLYLPPGVAHHGVAQNDCMTLSIGFRAPSHAEMLADFAGWLA